MPTSSVIKGKWISVFNIQKMDCPSEERMIRMALNSLGGIKALSFDLPNRRLEVLHDGAVEPITTKLASLGLGASLEKTQAAATDSVSAIEKFAGSADQESHILLVLLGINALMFIVELTAGLLAQSAGLIGESLDNFADAAVYGIALYAVGHSIKMQVRAAQFAGVLQLILALGVLAEVLRRFVFGSEPESVTMMAVAFVAMIANIICMLLISRHRDNGAHMKASWIFSANDVVINVGVICSGALVLWTGSNYPDLIIGTVAGLIVLNGARRILALRA
ncbi:MULTISPECIES: cation transporter [unclassified Methylophaga]|jgi:Co/Zn/Cd efflux system component|uniref:cation transporter n=1 Tax=unclassified Methylophaga TaxID=2629249 RepID=UPI000C8FDA3F|nr:sodium:proton antiporter [Methylophaga sp.]MAY16315.1 sodium:proton antiporter [Methylophaga sp.]HAO26011.1 sodium:proton antiporter [Methylophaga sp.]HCD06074.1 sodium:proton antiporter [Methylophaga sp.]|tara:strand:+ start:1776 stop:2612 length:837 start_codon:yes stop_codon:yes gene_type:complete